MQNISRLHPRALVKLAFATTLGATLLVGPMTLLASCTVIVNGDARQCETADDCSALDETLVGFSCSAEGICEPPPSTACATADECIERNDGAPSICLEGNCVQLTNEHCQRVVPEDAVGNDNAIVVGWMGPLVGDFASLGNPIERGAELALAEINANQNGLPAVSGGQRRPLIMVACHDLDDTDAVTDHLVNKLKVPAIIGPAFSGITVKVATDVTIPGGTLLVSASATSPQITGLDDDDLVWRTCPSDAIQTIPLVTLVGQVETRVRNEQGLTPADNIRVTTVAKGDAYGLGLAGSLAPLLEFNGLSAAANGGNYLPAQYDDPSVTPDFDYSTVVSQIVAFEPHIVLPLGTNEGITEVMLGVEAAWPTSGMPPPRPYYLVPDGGRLQELLDATDGNDDLRLRIKGTVPGRRGVNYDAFAIRYRMAFDNEEPGTYAENAYDAGYLLAYSILATGNQPLTGANLASSMMRMSEGTAINAGPSDVNAAYTALTNGSDPKLNYDGASGPLDFDNAVGEAPSNIDVWCIAIDQISNKPVFTSSGQFYDAASDTLQGTDTCEGW